MVIKKKKSEEPKLKPNEKYCFKCKEVVNVKDFNAYYGICHPCVDKSNGH